MSNKFTYRSAKNVHDLWLQLAKHKSVYFAPLDRMMPTAFFKGYIWHDALKKHFDNGSFFFRAERSNSERIRETIRNFELPTKPFSLGCVYE
jgi:hypothetical protein